MKSKTVKIVAISDTHGRHRDLEIPPCDILIHTGDASVNGEIYIIKDLGDWMREMPAKHRVFVPGNHDTIFERNPVLGINTLGPDIETFITGDKLAVIEGLTFFGAPIVPAFRDGAFTRSEEEREQYWESVGNYGKVDVLLTHGPPKGVLDTWEDKEGVTYVCGCPHLAKYVFENSPTLHIFGHIHEGHGKAVDEEKRYTAYNVSVMSKGHNLTNKPTIINLEVRR